MDNSRVKSTPTDPFSLDRSLTVLKDTDVLQLLFIPSDGVLTNLEGTPAPARQ